MVLDDEGAEDRLARSRPSGSSAPNSARCQRNGLRKKASTAGGDHGEADEPGQQPVAVLDHRVGVERRHGPAVAFGPVRAAEPGAGEPHAGAGEDDQRQRRQGDQRSPSRRAGGSPGLGAHASVSLASHDREDDASGRSQPRAAQPPLGFARPCRPAARRLCRRSIRPGTGPGLRVLRGSAFLSKFERHHVRPGSPWRSLAFGSTIDFVDHRRALAAAGLRRGRARRCRPTCAAASVWQPPQPLLAKTWAPGPPGTLGGAAPGTPAQLADVGGDVVEVLAADHVGRHRDRRVVGARARDLDLALRPSPSIVSSRPRRLRARRRRRRRGWGRSCAVVPASASVWQVPHFWMKRTRPRLDVRGGGAAARGAISATAASAARASRARMGFGSLVI